jgi:hypothetical protein
MADTPKDTPKRHWNGTVGNRHEHQNVWMIGGARAPAQISPWAGMERRVSSISLPFCGRFLFYFIIFLRGGSHASITVIDHYLVSIQDSDSSTKSNGNDSNRSNPLFNGLTTQKRNVADQTIVERRKSFTEQVPRTGFFSTWWHGYTKGH